MKEAGGTKARKGASSPDSVNQVGFSEAVTPEFCCRVSSVLQNTSPQNLMACNNNNPLLFITLLVGQEFWKGLAGQFWLGGLRQLKSDPGWSCNSVGLAWHHSRHEDSGLTRASSQPSDFPKETR